MHFPLRGPPAGCCPDMASPGNAALFICLCLARPRLWGDLRLSLCAWHPQTSPPDHQLLGHNGAKQDIWMSVGGVRSPFFPFHHRVSREDCWLGWSTGANLASSYFVCFKEALCFPQISICFSHSWNHDWHSHILQAILFLGWCSIQILCLQVHKNYVFSLWSIWDSAGFSPLQKFVSCSNWDQELAWPLESPFLLLPVGVHTVGLGHTSTRGSECPVATYPSFRTQVKYPFFVATLLEFPKEHTTSGLRHIPSHAEHIPSMCNSPLCLRQ